MSAPQPVGAPARIVWDQELLKKATDDKAKEIIDKTTPILLDSAKLAADASISSRAQVVKAGIKLKVAESSGPVASVINPCIDVSVESMESAVKKSVHSGLDTSAEKIQLVQNIVKKGTDTSIDAVDSSISWFKA